MSEVKTLAMLVLGGAFDATELGDNEIYPDMSLIEALQQELVTGFDDVSIELVSRIAYDAAQSELAALREELASTKTSLEAVTLNLSRVDDCLFKKSLRLTAAEQRNAELEKNSDRYIWLRDKSEAVHQFYLSTPIWFTGVKFNPDSVDSTIDAAMAKPTESGASE